MYSIDDPADQVELQTVFESARKLLDRTASALIQAMYVMKLAYVAAMSGLAATVEASAPYIDQQKQGFKRRLDSLDTVHRGGRCPGTIVRGGIAEQLPRFMIRAGNDIARQLSECSSSVSSCQRRRILCSVVIAISNMAANRECSVNGCGAYKCKRIVEGILLAGLTPNIAIPHILRSDLVALAGCWPLPAGSRKGLARIMPGLRSRTRQQQSLQALFVLLGSGGRGKSVPVSTISAML